MQKNGSRRPTCGHMDPPHPLAPTQRCPTSIQAPWLSIVRMAARAQRRGSRGTASHMNT